MFKKLAVWTNGRGIRKWAGQDTREYLNNLTKEKGYQKMDALLFPADTIEMIEEYSDGRIVIHTKTNLPSEEF